MGGCDADDLGLVWAEPGQGNSGREAVWSWWGAEMNMGPKGRYRGRRVMGASRDLEAEASGVG